MTLIIHLPVELLEHISRYLDIKQYHHFRISFQNLLNIRVRLNWDMFIESLEIVEELIPEMYLTTFIQFINSNRLDILCEFDFQHLILNRLIHYGKDVNDVVLRKIFLKSVTSGWKEIMEWILNVSDLDPTYDQHVAIILASGHGQLDCLKILLQDTRMNPTTCNNYAIQSASANGHYECVALLLNDGRVDPTANFNHALRMAAANRHSDAVSLLLTDPRVDPSVAGSFYCITEQ